MCSDDTPLVANTGRRLLVCLVVFTNLLVAATWRLWVPPTATAWSDSFCPFPRVPLVSVFGQWPAGLDIWLLGVMLVSSWGLLAFRFPRIQRAAPWAFVLATLLLMLGNQHRIQSWLYQVSTLCLMSVLLRPRAWVQFGRWHVISIYVFSAWSKLDYTFVHSLGQQFLDIVLAPAGVADWEPGSRQFLALLFPMVELFVGLGLIWPRTRWYAAIAAVSLHVILLRILGPWGLNHHWGVLLWNTQFIVMIAILFFGPRTDESSHESMVAPVVAPMAPSVAVWKRCIVAAILLLPALEPWGLVDHWPSWQLYAPRNNRVTLHVFGTEAIEQMPAPVRKYVLRDDTAVYRRVDLDAWSLDSLNAPIYPQDRFQLGVAMDFLQRSGFSGAAKVTIEGTAERWTGRRRQVVLHGREEMEKAARSYRLNAFPAEYPAHRASIARP